jgi:hypothetical protein
MSDKGWKSKGAKVPRISPRKQRKTCGRPFNAPRTKTVKQNKVAEAQECDVQVIEKESVTDKDSQVELVTETQNLRDIEAKRLAIPPLVNPYPKGIQLMSAREANEEARHGEVLRWSSDDEETKDSNADKTSALDKTPSPPECLKSPEPIQARIPGSVFVDRIKSFAIESRRVSTVRDKVGRDKNFKGVNFVPETEAQEGSSDSEDDVPVCQLLEGSKMMCLSVNCWNLERQSL